MTVGNLSSSEGMVPIENYPNLDFGKFQMNFKTLVWLLAKHGMKFTHLEGNAYKTMSFDGTETTNVDPSSFAVSAVSAGAIVWIKDEENPNNLHIHNRNIRVAQLFEYSDEDLEDMLVHSKFSKLIKNFDMVNGIRESGEIVRINIPKTIERVKDKHYLLELPLKDIAEKIVNGFDCVSIDNKPINKFVMFLVRKIERDAKG